MRLLELHLRRAAGLPEGLPGFTCDAPVVVVLGPNASGKSTLARAILGTLWPELASRQLDVRTRWSAAAGSLDAGLVHGRVTWSGADSQHAGPPRVRAELGRRYAFGLGRVLSAQRDDQELLRRVQLDVSAGFDIDAARKGLRTSTKMPRSLEQEWHRAELRWREALRETDGLSEDERSRSQLQAEFAQLSEVPALVSKATLALEHARCVHELDLVRRRLGALPPELANLRGDEAEALEQLRADLESSRRDEEREEESASRLTQRVTALAFPDSAPSAEELRLQLARARRLTKLANDSMDLSRRVEAKQNRVRTLAERLRTHPDERPSAVDEAALADFEAALEARDALLAREREQAAALAVLRDAALPEDRETTEASAERIHACRRYLSLYRHRARYADPWVAWLSLGFALAGTALLALQTREIVGLLLLGLGIGALAARLRQSWLLNRDDEFAAVESEVRALLPRAPSLGPGAVQRLLAGLEERHAQLVSDDERASRANALRAEHESVSKRLAAAESELAERCRAAGLRAEWSSRTLAQQARTNLDWLRAHDELEELRGALAAVEEQLDERQAELVPWLESFDSQPLERAEDAELRLRNLEERCAELTEVRRAREERRGALREARARKQQLRQRIESLWQRSGCTPDDDAALDAKLALHEEFTGLAEQERNLSARREQLAKELAAPLSFEPWSNVAPLDCTPDEADELLEALREQLEARSALATRIGALGAKLEAAEAGHSLASAAQDRAALQERIREDRERLQHQLLVDLFLGDAEASLDASQTPRLIARAKGQFERATKGRFTLEFAREGGLALRARDVRADQTRELTELSDATRIHLLLSARIAAIEEAEAGRSSLPLLLDETLSTSDPERWQGIASALLEHGEGGRQLFYFTADPHEAQAWQQACAANASPEPCIVDLAQLRWGRSFWREQPLGDPSTKPGFDELRALGPDELAIALDLPAPDGFARDATWHLYHVLFDEASFLADCLEMGITHIGLWKRAAARGQLPRDPGRLHARVEARALLLDAVLSAWRIGRGRPLEIDTVLDSGAISDTYVGEALELMTRHAREPAAFLEAVAELPRFRESKAQQLRTVLEEEGHLDERIPLTERELVFEALSGTRERCERLGESLAACRDFAERLVTLLAV